ncbi:MAG: preprotein translocase subunit SecG [Opitutaceae bacterium]|nr:preprotein translocase subunit SecG [Opitutaceae bacterium]
MSILLGILTFVLIVVSVLLVLLVLMQKAKDGGAGAALGGGMTESAFGADTQNVLSGTTIKAAIAFFVLSFVLYLGHLYQRNHSTGADEALPTIQAPAVPATTTENVALPAAETPAPADKPVSDK